MKYLLLLACCCFGCQSDPAPQQEAPPAIAPSTSQAAPDIAPNPAVVGNIAIETFEDWTGNLDGSCWCLLQPDPSKDESYCFAFARNGVAGKMILDGQRVVLRRGATVRPSTSDDYLSFLHENKDYRVQTSLTQEDQQGESIFYSGRLNILHKADGREAKVQVSGNCGC